MSKDTKDKYAIVNPLEHLSDEQKKKMKELREITKTWGVAPKEEKFLDDMCLFRYLDGLHYDMEVTKKQLKETVEWRAKYDPESITLEELEPVAKQGHMFTVGFDKYSRPVIYFIMGKDTLENDEKSQSLKFRYVVWMMEQCVKLMPPGIYKATWVIDLKDSSLSLSVIKQVKDMFAKLGDYYTERLACALVTNYSWSIGFIWGFVSKFILHPETVAKYKFLNGSITELPDQFAETIDVNQLIPEFGGKSTFKFDYALAVKHDKERIEKEGKSETK
jgi:hypothetical protein